MGGRGVRGASLYKRLSALRYGGTVGDRMNEYVCDGNFATKFFHLDSCVKELRKYGQYPLALAVCLPIFYTRYK